MTMTQYHAAEVLAWLASPECPWPDTRKMARDILDKLLYISTFQPQPGRGTPENRRAQKAAAQCTASADERVSEA